MEFRGVRASLQAWRAEIPSKAAPAAFQRDAPSPSRFLIANAAMTFDRSRRAFPKAGEAYSEKATARNLALPDLSDKPTNEIQAENIHATQPLYTASMLEGIRLTSVTERFVGLSQDGLLPIGTQGSQNLRERTSFFSGKLLDASDLQDEQEYHRKKKPGDA